MKKIKGYTNYGIDEFGNVINLNTGRVLKKQKNQKGYFHVQLSEKGTQKTLSIHKLVYKTFIGEINKGYEINHIDGNKENNSVKNLELVTKKENMLKAVKLGLIKSGEENKNSVQVLKINPITNEVIEEFGSINIAQRKTGILSSSISLASRGKRATAGGFKWKVKN